MPKPKRNERLRVEPYTNRSGTESWRVIGTAPIHGRVRQNFKDKSTALAKLSELEADLAGVAVDKRLQPTTLTAQQLSDAETAVQTAGDRQLSRIISHYLGLQQRTKAKGLSLDEAVAFVESQYRPELTEISILNARAEFLRTRGGLSSKTVSFYEAVSKLLLSPDPNKLVHQFNVADIEKVLLPYKNLNSKRTNRRGITAFFNWAVRHHYCLENPCDRLDKIPAPATDISILSLDEVKRLLQAAVEYRDGSMVPVIAIALFAGLRPSEIADLNPDDVNDERIRVSGGKMRRKIKRAVPIRENLKAWLKKYPFTGLPDGHDYRQRVLKDATNAKGWVQDILRHTSISYQAERDKNEGQTAYNNGTSKAMMDRHYRDVLDDPKQVLAYWSITPDSLAKEKTKVELPRKEDRDWPPNKRLKEMVWQKAMIHVARDLGVSNVALKKHCVKAGIDLPPLGYWLKPR